MSHPAKKQPDGNEDGDLRSERLRGRDANLGPGMHVNTAVALARDAAGDVVADAEGAIAFAPAFAHRSQLIRGLTALANGEHQGVACHRRIAMPEYAGEFHFGGNLREGFD